MNRLVKFILVCIHLGIALQPTYSQCIDTNTLLDSIQIIKLEDLNDDRKIIDRRDREFICTGNKYLMLITDKMYVGLPEDSILHDADTSRVLGLFGMLGSVKNLKDDYLMAVEKNDSTAYRLVVQFSSMGQVFLISVNSQLKMIDFILFRSESPSLYTTDPKTKKTIAMDEDGCMTKYKDGIFLKTKWHEHTDWKTQRKKRTETLYKRYVVSKEGKFCEVK